MTDKIVVYTTCSSNEAAGKLAAHLVEQRLAACVSVAAVQSHYRWKGAVENAAEWMLTIKSSRSLFERLKQEIARVHEYEVPELLALPVVDGAPGYLAWLDESLDRTI